MFTKSQDITTQDNIDIHNKSSEKVNIMYRVNEKFQPNKSSNILSSW